MSNSTNPEIREALLNRSLELRGQLTSKLKREGNFGVAQIDIDGLPSELKAHSKINFVGDKGADKGFVLLKPQDEWAFIPKKINSSGYIDDAGYLRHADTEFKLLEDIAARLGNNTQASGRVNLFTERLACQSCGDVILDFRSRYPNVQLNVFSRDFD
ncbi:deaminase domain-containing protein [Aliikangiella maris]|uniref:Deaminase domain-containing protein n=2 Tax=Aliikangiella maris TaxID=3162458 RepID=A0ABV2BWP9_9GAMM